MWLCSKSLLYLYFFFKWHFITSYTKGARVPMLHFKEDDTFINYLRRIAVNHILLVKWDRHHIPFQTDLKGATLHSNNLNECLWPLSYFYITIQNASNIYLQLLKAKFLKQFTSLLTSSFDERESAPQGLSSISCIKYCSD